jgi:hypothetical protein
MLAGRPRSRRFSVLPVSRLPAILALAAPVPGEACTPPVRAAAAALVAAAVAAPAPGRGQRTCRASGHLTHKLCPGRTRVHGLQRAKDVHPPALDHAWHDHPVRAAQTQGISCASLAAGARSKSMGHLLEGQVVPGVINPSRSAHTRSASGLPQAAIS